MIHTSPSPSSTSDYQVPPDVENMIIGYRMNVYEDPVLDTKENPRYRLDGDLKAIPEPVGFLPNILDRGGWLLGLLLFQSCSSFILSANQDLLRDHPVIIYFLTMLVGAGGNAGNQAAVRVIRRIALGR